MTYRTLTQMIDLKTNFSPLAMRAEQEKNHE